jgi:DNA-binding phage protein
MTTHQDDQAMQEMRAAVKQAIGKIPMRIAAEIAQCSPQTLRKVLRRENVMVSTVSRIMRAHGYRLRVSAEREENSRS